MYIHQRFEKKIIALEFLKNAQIAYQTKNYFSALHLAGASEEILRRYLTQKEIENALESEINASIAFCKHIYNVEMTREETYNFLQRSKNSIKHMDNFNEREIDLDPAEEARVMIIRALTNLWRLGETTSDLEQFWLTIEEYPPCDY